MSLRQSFLSVGGPTASLSVWLFKDFENDYATNIKEKLELASLLTKCYPCVVNVAGLGNFL